MSLDCAELHECADLLHEVAAERFDAAARDGSHQPGYVGRLREVVAIEELAAELEGKIADDC